MNKQRGGIEFTLIAIIVGVAALGIASIKIVHDLEKRGVDKCEAAHTAAIAQAQDLENQLEAQGRQHIDELEAARQVGEQKGRAEALKVYRKGASDVQKYAVFANVACTLPDESVGNLNGQRRTLFGLHDDADSNPGVRPAAAPSGSAPAVSSPGLAPKGRQDGNTVSGTNLHHRPLGSVQSSPQSTGGTR